MIGTNLPAIINDDLEFVIVGPIYKFEGIIVKSVKVSHQLIAQAKKIYSSTEANELFRNQRYTKYRATWSSTVVPPFYDKRPVSLLLAWISNNNGWLDSSRKIEEIEEIFSYLAQDLYNIAMQNELTQHEKDNLILWLLAPLVERLNEN